MRQGSSDVSGGQSRGSEGEAGQEHGGHQQSAAAAVAVPGGAEVGGPERAGPAAATAHPNTHRQSGFDLGWKENPRFKPWLYYKALHGEYHI